MLQGLRRTARRVRNAFRRKNRPQKTAVVGENNKEIIVDPIQQVISTPHLAMDVDSLIKRQVTNIDFNNSYFSIEGMAWFESFPEKDPEKIVKSLVLINEDGRETVIALNNSKVDLPGYPQAGYYGSINFSKINNGGPLDPGRYEIRLRMRQYLSQGWLIRQTSLGQIKNTHKNLNYTTKMTSYSAQSNKTYSLIFEYNLAEQSMHVSSHKLSDINPLENEFTSDYELDSAVGRRLKRTALHWWYRWYSLRPIKSNKVSFVSDSRTSISGNFEFIYEDMQKEAPELQASFYLKPNIKAKKSWHEVRTLAKALATSRFIILDDFYPLIYPLKIRDNADLIQVWHAVGAFKTFGYSRVGMPGGPKLTSLNHRNYTKVLVSATSIAPKYAEGFGIDPENVLPLGIPRTDIFFDTAKQDSIKTRLKEELPFINGKKVILFAPTFRGNGQQSADYPFETLNFKKLYDSLHEDYVFLLKIHPFVQNKPTIPYEYTDFFYDVSDYREINDLLLIADQLITDYSSVCFEYALLKRPMVFFAPDLAEYMKSRSFYYDYFDFIPGQLAESMDELLYQLENPKVDKPKLDAFVDYFFDDLDGKSTQRFVHALKSNFGEDDKLDLEDERYSEDGKYIPEWGKKAEQSRK
ncbi:CDP-glycerol glycerophosphotransferase family protein [Pediococcus claussenii]|uniref:Poly(Glycerophosphate) glycerophosphotransferase family protein n=1 Tax=Pediococcus claussenii (strain ATCC BAA-344 / DSM 14800 / JCM 18046 / KCTC 3811 / LMG 21948 / P06) TaxID=701521 RepID=G8PC70_PEDCP|nr:CDP-glycerol glycerophosphotransferase family protein [Pediococcus claussenii]AEV96048.1 Poly(glycerophosphate) glycerophosphotransferase family protein [Pediococcus claussenii ATCC BAA-344]KRN19428.1 hypothetical protein IV79_GL001480 [Pediococcus claussenii]